MPGVTIKATAAAVFVAFMIGAAPAAENNEHIARCTLAVSSEARIACLENVIRELFGAPEMAAMAEETTPVVAPDDTISPSDDNAAAAVIVTAASRADPDDIPVADAPVESVHVEADVEINSVSAATETIEEAVEEVVAEAAGSSGAGTNVAIASASTSATAVPAQDDALDSLGQEQVERIVSAENEPQRIRATVVSYEFVGYNKLRVHLENGQIWRQSNADRPNLSRALRNKDQFEVDLWETERGRFRMYVVDANKTLTVRRIK